MKEELISFETAKLAKEKRFDVSCRVLYNKDGSKVLNNRHTMRNNLTFVDDSKISAPTQSLLQRWLREVHELNLYISLSGTKEISWFWSINDKEYQDGSSNTYEQALEAGLLEALKLIKI
jgi:hypothetical protein